MPRKISCPDSQPALNGGVTLAQFWGEGRQCLNLLVVPWPPRTSPAHFRSVDVQNAVLPDMPDNFGFFEYEPPKNLHDPYKAVKGLLAHAHEVVDKVHGVIFPELALTPNELAKIRSYLVEEGYLSY